MSILENIADYMQQLGKQARQASRILANTDTQQKNQALLYIAEALEANAATLKAENAKDLAAGRDKGLDDAMLDRLTVSDKTIASMAEGVRQVASLADPIGTISDMNYRPSGIQIGKMRVPLGVVGMIYESRPNVTIEAASLALKSSNAIILRGGSEAFNSNQALAQCVKQGLVAAGLPETAVQVVETTDRSAVGELITMKDYVDVIIPRGGKGLIERISNEATIPVIKHLDGNCHTFIDRDANRDMAIDISVNAKTSRYGTCNTMETLLIEAPVSDWLADILTAMVNADNAMQQASTGRS